MRRLIYLCPEASLPIGGVKVIYRHVEALNELGVPAFVLHPHAVDFRYSWSKHSVPFLDSTRINAASDFVVIPEVYTLEFGLQCRLLNCPYAIFVQNGYLMHPAASEDAGPLRETMRDAAFVMSMSADTDRMLLLNFPGLDQARLVRVRFAVPDCFISGQVSPWVKDAARVISYMPRKLPNHARQVAYALRQYLPPRWLVQSIDNVDEAACAAMLRNSRIFLSFSEFEGLGLPPLEAALAGNLVIGYTGQGGAEYWEPPNFRAIAQGDIFGFVEAARSAANQIEAGLFGPDILSPGRARLARRFSAEAETGTLRMMCGRVPAHGALPA